MKKQNGFTLIELVVVIVILGILAATALPRFVDLSTNARLAATQGFAGAINGGDAINYATYLARRTVTNLSADTNEVQNTTAGCTLAVANSLLRDPMPATYAVAGATVAAPAGTVNACVLTAATGETANFNITVAR